MKACLIITGGKLDVAFARSFLKKEHFDKVIAVDGGLEAAKKLEIIPDYIVGDFDTVSQEILEEYQKYPHIVWEQHRPEKNETDTELARSLGLTLGCGKMVFLGATGGRLDHMLGNLHTLYACLECGVEAYLVDAQNKICLLDQGKTFFKEKLWGKYVSFLPYTEEVKAITLTGFKYPLQKKTIKRGKEPGLCISNEVEQDWAQIEFEEGILICIESED